MEAATLERNEAVVSTPTTLIYLARRAELQLVHTPVRPIYGAGGQKQDETKGKRIEFHEGRFDCPLDGDFRFPNGERMAADDLRAWLDGHRLNGDSAEGFWRVDPTAPAPSADELQSIVDLAMELKLEALEETLRAEQQGWQREAVIVMATRAIEKVKGVRSEIEAGAADRAKAAAAPEAEREVPETVESPASRGRRSTRATEE